MSLKRWVRRWLNNDPIEVGIQGTEPVNHPDLGTRVVLFRIDNGWLLEHKGAIRYVADFNNIPEQLPGLIAWGKMNAEKERY